MNYLSLKSGKLKITNVDTSSLGGEEKRLCEPVGLHAFKGIYELLKEHSSKENVSVLIYISGYIAYSVKKKITCSTCFSRLSSDKNLDT